jgi:peptide/nickel transport system substrate-binding protein
VLVFGEYSEPNTLDPIINTGALTGAIQMTAVYDTIMRWNPETGEYEPRTAESLEPNDDFTEWTLKLKPGIQFSDGTPYDAEAVIFGMMRHKSGTPGAPPCAELYACPRNSTSSNVYMQLVRSMQAVDDLTVEFTLTEPWTAFAYALSDEAAMIPSPTAYKAACTPDGNAAQCSFALNPVGAGPFKVSEYRVNETIRMVRNDNYYGGDVYLDGLEFLNPGDAGGDITWEGFDAGTYDAAFLRSPTSIASAEEAGVGSYSAVQYGGGLLLVNMGVPVNCSGGQPAPVCTGKPDGPTPSNPPTANEKVRQAMAYAIDPEVIDQRAYNGLGLPGNQLLQEDFRWYPDVEGYEYDPEQAKQLVTEAKAEGWDGTIRLLYNNTPTAQAVGLAAQTMLQAAGFQVALDTTVDTRGQINKIVVQKDFDATGWGLAISSDDGAMAALAQNFSSTSSSNRVGLASPVIDKALSDLRAAETDEEKTEAFRTIVQVVRDELPVLPWAAIEERIVWQDDVHGLVFNHSTSVFFDKAWMG